MSKDKFNLLDRLKSFKFAFNGLRILIKEEHNSRIHFFVALCVLTAGFFFKITAFEWISILFAIGFVIVTEIINTSIENLANFISPEKNVSIKKIKDLAAAGVLISAIIAAIIGVIIFLPKILVLC
jgi:undecaprenol kinase/diacylglycerol kinase (ATP)